VGTSTNAILFYGFGLGSEYEGTMDESTLKSWAETMGIEPDEHGYFDHNDFDWEEVFCKRIGTPEHPESDSQYKDGTTERRDFRMNPTGERREYGPVGERTPERVAEWDRLKSECYQAERDAKKNAGCDILSHCSGDYPMYYVTVERLHYTCYRGDEKEVTADMLNVTPEDKEKLQAFCKLMDLPWQEPKWYLVSYWG
jgi:hypothetical protein